MGKKSTGTRRDYDVGYGRPPKSGQTKRGEVRNPWGRNGKPKPAEDLLLKVAEEEILTNINGKVVSMTLEEALYRTLMQDALNKKASAQKLALDHLSKRRPPLPPVPTPEELAQQQAEEEQKRALSARLVGLLQEEATRKKREAPRLRRDRDGKPIVDRSPDDSSPGPVDEPVEKPRG